MLGRGGGDEGGLNGMPSTTATSHRENHLPPGDNNGYFVRPVAVSGIFKPALADVENVPKKPALPEKRRFSVLAGDLQPIGDSPRIHISNEEFARRRQSWDTRSTVNAPPFGQSVLKKTPKRNSPSRTIVSSKTSGENDLMTTATSKESINHQIVINGQCNGNSLLEREDYLQSTKTVVIDQRANCYSEVNGENTAFANTKSIITQNAINKKCVDQRSTHNTTSFCENIDERKTCTASPVNAERRRQRPQVNDCTAGDQANNPAGRRSRPKVDTIQPSSKSENLKPVVNGNISANDTKVLLNSHTTVSTDILVNSSSQPHSKNPYSSGAKARVRELSNKNIENDTQTAIKNNNSGVITHVTESQKYNETIGKAQNSVELVSEPQKTQKVYGLIKRDNKDKGKVPADDISLETKKSFTSDSKKTNDVIPTCTVEKVGIKTEITKQSNTVVDNKITEVKSENVVILRDKSSNGITAAELPKHVRTARRTSDIIAAKIQSIFSNAGSEKRPSNISTVNDKSEYSTSRKANVSNPLISKNHSEDIDHVQRDSSKKDFDNTLSPTKKEPAGKQPLESKTPTNKSSPKIVDVMKNENTSPNKPNNKSENVLDNVALSMKKGLSNASVQKISEMKDSVECQQKSSSKIVDVMKNENALPNKLNNKPENVLDNVALSMKKGLSNTSVQKTSEIKDSVECQRKSSANESDKMSSFKLSNPKVADKHPNNPKAVDKHPEKTTTTEMSVDESAWKIVNKEQTAKSDKKLLIKNTDKGTLTKVSNNEMTSKSFISETISKYPAENWQNSLSKLDSKANLLANKTSATVAVSSTLLKSDQQLPIVNSSDGATCQKQNKVNDPLSLKKESKILEKSIQDKVSLPNSSSKITSSTKIKDIVASPPCKTFDEGKSVLSKCSTPSSVSANTTPSTVTDTVVKKFSTITNLTKNVENCASLVAETQQNVKKSAISIEQEKTSAHSLVSNQSLSEFPKCASSIESPAPSAAILKEPVNKISNAGISSKLEKNISTNDLSVRPKNLVELNCVTRSASNAIDQDFFKSAAKNLVCTRSSPLLPRKSNSMTASLSNLATPSSSNLMNKENSESLLNGSASSIESLVLDSSKAPRPPERKRSSLQREASLSSSSISPQTTVMRTASLRRFDDSKFAGDKPVAILRSPSHSTLPASYNPHRYSYTEMLSKVCSYGISPSTSSFNPPYKKYSVGSLSSSLSQVSELWSDLSQEQSSSTHTSEMLESETTERMRLEKEVSDLQSRYSHVQQKSNKMEMEMMEARVYRSSDLNGDLSDDEDCEGNASIYKQKYENAVQDMEIMKRRIQQQREEEVEQSLLIKKASDKKLAEALADVEEERQVANQWKRKAQKLGSELQDLRLMLEEQMARNGELEKKQRGFDAELFSCKEEIKKERLLREKSLRERDQAQHEKYSLEQELHSTRLDMDMQHEKITQLNRELDELSLSSKGEEEVTQLKRTKQELERKCRDQEEELEEYVGQAQMLEQAKLRLEMSLEKLRQEHRRESSVREEEIEELRASFSKKIKNLEAQLESEQEDRHQLVKQKHELERRVIELTDMPPPQDPDIERRLRRDLKRTKALLRDAQSMLEHVRDGQGSKSVVRQLKNQLEDAEFAKCSAIKAKQTAETELQELQTQLEEVTRNKNDHESRCLQLSREKSALQSQLEEIEEEMSEVMKKYKCQVSQASIDQKAIAEQNQQIAELDAEKNALREQLSEVNNKFEHLAGQSEDTHRTFRLDAKVRDLESKLELEQTSRARLEHQIARLKEQIDRLQEECDSLRNKELQAQEGIRRFQRQLRDLREDYSTMQQKEAEAYRKQHELEMALENTEAELKITKNDLRLACQRIEELKNALEDDLDSGTDVPDDSGSDSDSSLDMSNMLRPSLTPIQRCDSVSSDLSFGSRRSVTPSYGELAAFCRGMWRQTSTDFLT